MFLNQDFIKIADLSKDPDFILSKNFTRINLNSDPAIVNSFDSDPAWKDSFVIHTYVSDIFKNKNFRYKYVGNYNLETKKYIDIVNEFVLTLYDKQIIKGTLIKSMIVVLNPQGEQIPHVDGFSYHSLCERLLIPLETNDLCLTYFEGRSTTFAEGNLYNMNNKILHYSTNKSNFPRFTLFIDNLPEYNKKLFLNIKI